MFDSDHNRILHNSAGNNGDVGLFMARSDHNQIRKNSCVVTARAGSRRRGRRQRDQSATACSVAAVGS